MITDSKICSRVTSIMQKKGGPRFNQKWADLIAKWCGDHFQRYDTPPNGNIEIIFNKWADQGQDDDTVSQIESLLDYMSREYSNGTVTQNPDFVLDLAGEYFNKTRLREAVEDIEDDVDVGDVERAYETLQATSKIELGYSNTIHPFEEPEVWFEVFNDEETKAVFEYPGDLGKLVGPSFVPGSFYAFTGVDKAGKSFYLLDAVWRALKNRKKVAYFEVGDLGKELTMQRLGQRILRTTLDDDFVNWPTGDWNGNKPELKRRRRQAVSIGHAIKLGRRHTRGRRLLKVSCHPNNSISISGINEQLQDWVREENWMPDVVVIDYADILAPPPGVEDGKDQIDETWKGMRRMSQEFNNVVLTATQTGSQTYRKQESGMALSRADFSGRKTKNAHVDGILGINATPIDKQNEMTRINWVVRRRGKETKTICLVAGCLACGTPIIHTKFLEYKKVEEE